MFRKAPKVTTEAKPTPRRTLSPHVPLEVLTERFDCKLPSIGNTPASQFITPIITAAFRSLNFDTREGPRRIVADPSLLSNFADPVIAQIGIHETRIVSRKMAPIVLSSRDDLLEQLKIVSREQPRPLVLVGYGLNLDPSVEEARLVTRYEGRSDVGTYYFDFNREGTCVIDTLNKLLRDKDAKYSQIAALSPSATLVISDREVQNGVSFRGIISGAVQNSDGVFAVRELIRTTEVHNSLTAAEREYLRSIGKNHFCSDILCSRLFVKFFNVNLKALNASEKTDVAKNEFSEGDLKTLLSGDGDLGGVTDKDRVILRTLLQNMILRAAAGAAGSIIESFTRGFDGANNKKLAFAAHLHRIDPQFFRLVQNLLDEHLTSIVLVPKFDQGNLTAEMAACELLTA